MQQLNFAVVGAGGHAAFHIGNIRKWGGQLGCRLAAVAIRPRDRQAGQVEQFGAEGVEVFADALEMFAATAGRVDGVFIPTSIYTHQPLACAALERGHNVYLEKPPAGTVQEVDAMVAAQGVSRRGTPIVRTDDWGPRICLLGFQNVFSHSIQLIKQRLMQGRLGAVRRMRTWAMWPRQDHYYARNEWAGRLRAGERWVLDGPSNNATAHYIANMLYLASPRRDFAAPASVRAELYHARDIESEDTSAMEIVTAEGVRLCFAVSHCVAGPHVGPWLEIECDGGLVQWDVTGRTRITLRDGSIEGIDANAEDVNLSALRNFVEAVRAGEGTRVLCDVAMGRNFTLAINGAFESAGRPRAIPARYVRRQGAGPQAVTVVDGLAEAVQRCGAEGKLFSDLGLPWARPTQPFDLAGYKGFPQTFPENP